MLSRVAFALIAAFGVWMNSNASIAAERVFDLTIDEVVIDVAADLKYYVFGFNKQVPGPLMHVREGDHLTINVTNNTTLPHTIHWHGFHQLNNWRNDGVPDVTQQDIKPGDSYTYTMTADRIGTLWYHCHVNVNEHVGIRGMWGPIVVDPKEPLPIEAEVTKDVIMMMSTWESVYAEKFGEGSIPGTIEDYFSVNARSFPSTQPLRIKTGDVIRVRMIGAGGATHAMHSHGHDMLVTHKDGLPLSAPYSVDTIMIGPGERYDLIIRANHDEGRFIFHDHVDKHVTAAGKFPGGPITVMEYAGTPMDDWYVWKNIEFDADFFYSESLKKGYGMFTNPAFAGEPIKRKRRRRSERE